MDHEVELVEFEPDDLEQVPGGIGPDGEHLGWVGVWFEIEQRDGVFQGVANGVVADAVLASRTVDFHIEPIS